MQEINIQGFVLILHLHTQIMEKVTTKLLLFLFYNVFYVVHLKNWIVTLYLIINRNTIYMEADVFAAYNPEFAID